MKPLPASEQKRVESLRSLGILDTAPEERFDRITRLTQRTFGTPIVVISLVDAGRVWFKSRLGIDEPQMPSDGSFCDFTVLGDSLLIVPDASKDQRFAAHPMVTGGPKIRFYAGQPLAGPDGTAIGTLSLLDTSPRDLDIEQRRALRDLAQMVEEQLAAAPREPSRPMDEHSRLLARLRLTPEHVTARRRIRAVFFALTAVLLIATAFSIRLAHRVRIDAERIKAEWNAPAARAVAPLERLNSTGRFLIVGVGARAVLATALMVIILLSLDRHMDGRLSALAAVELEHARLRAVIDAIGDGVVVADALGRFTVFNPAAERIMGLGLVDKPEETRRFYASFFKEGGEPCPPDKHPLERAVAGENASNERLIVRNERRPGGVPVVVSGTPVRSADGAPAGGVIFFRDVL